MEPNSECSEESSDDALDELAPISGSSEKSSSEESDELEPNSESGERSLHSSQLGDCDLVSVDCELTANECEDSSDVTVSTGLEHSRVEALYAACDAAQEWKCVYAVLDRSAELENGAPSSIALGSEPRCLWPTAHDDDFTILGGAESLDGS